MIRPRLVLLWVQISAVLCRVCGQIQERLTPWLKSP